MGESKKLAMIVAGVAGLGVVCFAVLGVFLRERQPPIDSSLIVEAVQKFRADHPRLPQSVTFSQLIADGYLGSNVLQRFGASEVTVYLKADASAPQSFRMDARLADGSHVTLLNDGSVQALPSNRIQEATSNAGPASVGAQPPR